MEATLLLVKDNLELLKEMVQNEPETIDLIYIDPPFNSGRDYYSIEHKRTPAFTDKWEKVNIEAELLELAELNPKLYKYLSLIHI